MSNNNQNASVVVWSTTWSDYQLLAKIGQGAFASVYKATSAENDCAVKVLNLDHVDTNLQEIRQEVHAMRLSAHDNVLPCYTAFVHDTNLWLVTPLMRKGSSIHAISRARKLQPTTKFESHIVYILHETLLGLAYMHAQGQIHRDVKAGNILLDSDGSVKIADFGVSGWLEKGGDKQEKAVTFVGTPCWMAPEVMEQVQGYDYKADIWSLGITALELAKGYAPYAKYPPMKVLILTIQEDPPTLDSYDDDNDDSDFEEEEWSKNFKSLIATCLQKDPSRRPTCQELLATKYFNNLKRDERQGSIKSEVCDIVEDIGTRQPSSNNNENQSLASTPVSIVLSTTEENRPAGTTWVFADGSQVLASTQTASSTKDVFDELDDFEKETGGENYSRTTKTAPAGSAAAAAAAAKEKEEHDDLEQFMNDFEMQTGGENFVRKPI